ncbi:hypothetical protein [Winogradskya humida]|uniref:Uncharacterized protein n=1 Tax=Winogradskya humida TaxID=113566 RepID=A0ABQ3ZNY9_9ACTN|nr:hypothetical protein [Actinoplanes humidus]GIE20289.1 hypothetical protein Ahu01nite_033910 [Actinoplanes humidus]
MDGKVLVKNFRNDPGATFVVLIREADQPVSLGDLRQSLAEAGVPVAEVNREWDRLRKSIKDHPHISKPEPARYEWSPAAQPSKESFQKLLAKVNKRGQAWLTQAYADNVMDSLAKVETSGSRAQAGWSEQREREKASLLAEIVAKAEVMGAEGYSGQAIVDWLRDEAQSRHLMSIGRVGEVVKFDRERHEPDAGRQPRADQELRVLRPGFVWVGGGHSVVVAKALVE